MRCQSHCVCVRAAESTEPRSLSPMAFSCSGDANADIAIGLPILLQQNLDQRFLRCRACRARADARICWSRILSSVSIKSLRTVTRLRRAGFVIARNGEDQRAQQRLRRFRPMPLAMIGMRDERVGEHARILDEILRRRIELAKRIEG